MNEDQVKGKVKDVAGRVERQAGEWTGSKEAETRGAAKQVEGKVQGAWGDVKDGAKKVVNDDSKNTANHDQAERQEKIRSDRKAS